LRQERSVEGKRAWPERLASNKAAAIEKFEARKRRDEQAAEASTGANEEKRQDDDNPKSGCYNG